MMNTADMLWIINSIIFLYVTTNSFGLMSRILSVNANVEFSKRKESKKQTWL